MLKENWLDYYKWAFFTKLKPDLNYFEMDCGGPLATWSTASTNFLEQDMEAEGRNLYLLWLL